MANELGLREAFGTLDAIAKPSHDVRSSSRQETDVKPDETSCFSGFCTHPTCWASRRRLHKGIPKLQPSESPRTVSKPSQKLARQHNSYTEDGLPQLSIQNMLDEYGESPSDTYPTKFGGRPTHHRAGQQYDTSTQREISFPMTYVPNASPISAPRSGLHIMRSAPENNNLKSLEVQEVFELDDLHSAWTETFVPSPYYIWVPNPRKRRKKPRNGPRVQDLAQGPVPVQPKDYTETMLPREIAAAPPEQRDTKANMSRLRRLKPSPLRVSRGTDSRLTNRSSRSLIPRIHDLRDIPRSVLKKVLDQLEKSGDMTRDDMRRMLSSLTHSDLVSQRGNKFIKQKQLELVNPTPLAQRGPYRLDQTYSNLPLQPSSYSLRGTRPPLPPVTRRDDKAMNHVPLVALGLPEIPSGVKYVRPFYYRRGQDMDFSLGRVPTPMSSSKTSYAPRDDSPESSNRVVVASVEKSHERVNAMEVMTDREHLLVRMPLHDPQHTDSAKPRKQKKSKRGSAPLVPATPMHAVSPTLSTHVPDPPAVTPATRQSAVKLQRDRTAPGRIHYTTNQANHQVQEADERELNDAEHAEADVKENVTESELYVGVLMSRASDESSVGNSDPWPQIDENDYKQTPMTSAVDMSGGVRIPVDQQLTPDTQPSSPAYKYSSTPVADSGVAPTDMSSNKHTFITEKYSGSASTINRKYDGPTEKTVEEEENEISKNLTAAYDFGHGEYTDESAALVGNILQGITAPSNGLDVLKGISHQTDNSSVPSTERPQPIGHD